MIRWERKHLEKKYLKELWDGNRKRSLSKKLDLKSRTRTKLCRTLNLFEGNQLRLKKSAEEEWKIHGLWKRMEKGTQQRSKMKERKRANREKTKHIRWE